MKRDYYEALGLSKDATKEQVKDAYKKLALKYHPDRNKSPDAEERFKEISEAYAVISDDEKRSQYDEFGHDGIDQRYTSEDIFRRPDFEPIFRDLGFGLGGLDSIFDMFFGRGRAWREERERRGSDLRYDLEISLEEVAKGATKDITFPRREACDVCGGTGARDGASRTCSLCQGEGQVRQVQEEGFTRTVSVQTCDQCGGKGVVIESPCQDCRGTGIVERKRKVTLTIPPGIESGMQLRLAEEGDSGLGIPPGDLFVYIDVKAHNIFERDASDIYCEVPVGFADAALGAEIKVPTLESRANLRIPEGTQTGTIFRLRGKGLPEYRGGDRGDLLVKTVVRTPTNLTERQRRILREFRREEILRR